MKVYTPHSTCNTYKQPPSPPPLASLYQTLDRINNRPYASCLTTSLKATLSNRRRENGGGLYKSSSSSVVSYKTMYLIVLQLLSLSRRLVRSICRIGVRYRRILMTRRNVLTIKLSQLQLIQLRKSNIKSNIYILIMIINYMFINFNYLLPLALQ